jgi:hypothetical protein
MIFDHHPLDLIEYRRSNTFKDFDFGSFGIDLQQVYWSNSGKL